MRALLALLILLCPATALADDPLPAAVAAGAQSEARGWAAVSHKLPELPEWRGTPKQHLALGIAKVAANESSMRTPGDVALIHQATMAHGSSVYARLRWLKSHSARVLGGECDPSKHGNCEWTRHLTWSARRPAGWPSELVDWRPSRWLRVLRLAWGLLDGHLTLEPCERAPYTWGGKMDHARALKHGLVPLGCEETLNEGYRLAAGGG